MDRVTNAIIKKLEQGTIKKIVLFSDQDVFPEPPYVCVKPEQGILEGTRAYRIIAHEKQGMFDQLEDYVLIELDRLLAGTLTDDDGSHYRLRPNGYTDIFPDREDNTYFMERLYYVPLTIRD